MGATCWDVSNEAQDGNDDVNGFKVLGCQYNKSHYRLASIDDAVLKSVVVKI